MAQLQEGLCCSLQTQGDQSSERCAAESCGRRKAQTPDPHVLEFKFSVTVWKGMGTLHWWCFKSNRYLIRCLEKCLLSTSGLTQRKGNGWSCWALWRLSPWAHALVQSFQRPGTWLLQVERQGWGVSRVQCHRGGVSRTLLLGLGSSQARCTHLDPVPARSGEHRIGPSLCGACPDKATLGHPRAPQKYCTMGCSW